MNITGVVEIDLTRFVNHRVLYIGDAEVHAIWPLLGDGSDRYLLRIGDAGNVRWDPRFVEMLADAKQVSIVGSNNNGVTHAVLGFRRALDRSAA